MSSSGSTPEVRIPASEATAKLKEMKSSMMEDAEKLIFKTIPRRILNLDEVLKSPDFKILDQDQYGLLVDAPEPTGRNEVDGAGDYQLDPTEKVDTLPMLPGAEIRLNQTLERLHKVVEPLAEQLVNDCYLLKMWIQLLIPKVEDGNNFGVGIQESCLDQVSGVQKDSASYIDEVTRYYLTRAKAVSKVTRYPRVEDFRRTVLEVDQKQYLHVTMFVRQLRNDYILLHDVLTKNIGKIQKPRNYNAENLY
ncbi:proteasome activator complex subunit 3 [Galendromus occidentalis]|uniref:Proteasome activator complex subunit 3 n=1 Tax=Galendromus occidentalis TaxID=34638 RepID=A0AAJ6W045_9ACAR|nr:proteasome activator complex subunit 3 [Galendromus occidentalis]